MKIKNVIGKKYGKLTILDDIKNKDKRQRILICICDCGNKCTVSKEKVLRGHTKSCGCLQKEIRKQWGVSNKKEYGEAAFNECYGQYRVSAKRRGYEFLLIKEEFKNIITKPCIYCGSLLTQEKRAKANNGTFRYTGIDRYDNRKGYTVDNCVPCCKICNRMKQDLSLKDFEKHITKVYKNKNMWKRIS